MILPGATLGMLGGGQLGRMFTVAARTMGYKVMVLDPDTGSPAGKISDRHLCAGFHDATALDELSRSCAAITTEFENVPADTLELLTRTNLVRPSAGAVATTQDRIQEKSFLNRHGIPTNRFFPILSEADIEEAVRVIGLPAMMKRSRLGYDGKGQWKVDDLQQAEDAFRRMGSVPCVCEEFLLFEKEISVVLVRSVRGEVAAYPTGENVHANGILDMTMVPARISVSMDELGQSIARQIADHLQYQGVLAVEMFVMSDERVLVNEIAPRPHNSGHYTLDACGTDQFEQQVRALCGFSPGDTRLLTPVVMFNLLGDAWGSSHPRWEILLSHPNVKLHLYGKNTARAGRKMGHFNCLASDVDEALQLGSTLREHLVPKSS